MKRFYYFFMVTCAICFCAMTSQAQAQATRTWVSGLGDDANPCSRTAPCKTWAGAISKTADCGEMDALDPGGFGTVTITKGVKLDGGGGEGGQGASILASGPPGITINNSSVNCPFVVIRNLDIQGIKAGTTGVNVVGGGQVSLENVDIENFTQWCFDTTGATAAVSIVMYSTNLERCGSGGLRAVNPSAIRVNVEKSTIHRNGTSGSCTGGVGMGVFAGNSLSFVNIHNSMVSNNSCGGVESNGSSAKIDLHQCTVANNQAFGVHATSTGIIQMAETSVVFNNGTGLLADGGGQILTWQNNWVGGNSIDGARTGPLTVQ